jgi:predicted unusual protein kinase regulating ubiquinone biosynthesis (AarF/ABC1/UbiB family)
MLKTIKNLSGLALQSVKLKKSDDQFLDQKSARMIVQLLGQERGIALKIAQMMGSNDAAMEEFKKLTEGENLQAIPLEEIGPVIQERMNGKVDDYYERVEEAKWVASLGQVHRCKLKNREGMFALKVLYPGIKKRLEDQLKLLGLFGMFGSKTKLKKWGFDISDYLENFEEALDKETNYEHEAKNLQKFHQFNRNRDIFYPEVIEELSSSELLVTTLMSGMTVEGYTNFAEHRSKKSFCENFLMTFLRQLLIDGFIQGDTHSGNFYIHQDKPVYLDFGHFLELTEKEKAALINIMEMLVSDRTYPILPIMGDVGFDTEKLKIIEEKLPVFVQVMFKPFLLNSPFSLEAWKPKEDIESLLGENKWWIRSSGDARFFQLVRSFWGVFMLLRQVGTPINWHQCAREVLAEAAVSIGQSPAKILSSNLSMDNSKIESKNLSVQVYRDGKVTVNLTFPSKAVFHLEELVDNETSKKLAERSIDIQTIKDEAIKKNLAPHTLFELVDENKKFLVRLV